MKNQDPSIELCLAVIEPSPETVKRLLADGIDVNVEGDKRYARVATRSPLWLAVDNAGKETSQSWTELYSAFRNAVPSISERDHTGTREKFLDIVRQLIQAGADLEKASFGGTPLRIAVHHRDLELVQILLDSGANPSAETFSIISKLVKRNSHTPAYYNTVLHEAVEKNAVPIVKALLAAGADQTRVDHEGKTPLAIAQEKGHKEIAELLEQENLSN